MHRTEIEQALGALNAALDERGQQARLILVGGAALALAFSARESTRDVDAIAIAIETPDRAGFLEVAASVGRSLGLPADWLNDRARGFASEVTSGATVWKGSALEVTVAAPEQLLAMKLSALRDDIDYEDAALLLRKLEGDKEQIWSAVRPFLVPGMEEWKRTNFDILWKDSHGSA